MATEIWTDEELDAAVGAYVEMLNQEKEGKPYVKMDYNRSLVGGPIANRSRKSIEWRMQNISAVLVEMGQDRIVGYKPARHVTGQIKDKIIGFLNKRGIFNQEEMQPVADQQHLYQRVTALRQKKFAQQPLGQQVPKTVQAQRTLYVRDPKVVAWVLEQAKGHCELCGSAAPFLTAEGLPFLEVHHVKGLAEGGPDTTENAVALCPNCHRLCHYAANKKEAVSKLLQNVARLQPF
ncbi:HNH endonuclease [Deinococcus roseus]|uniref:HNH endonuclease n=1 Tax=Deinococcus roseus TaxID=392414 RepID=A0ABQ2DFR3_9DEIO|nr:HNH endonuclease signature motif containing protein [Deinococcus roseus]GGJ56495.1 HNH endonuclease [Deinococcus roseus]